MLQTIREHAQGWIAWLIAGILCIAFALWGIEYYIGGGQNTEVAATVNGQEISQDEWESNYRRLQQAIPVGERAEFDQSLQAQLKQEALSRLIRQAILAQAAAKAGYIVTQQQVALVIASLPEFQMDGKFSPMLFTRMAEALFGSEQLFLQDIQAGASILQASIGIVGTAFTLPSEVTRLMDLRNEKRNIQYIKIPAESFLSTVKVSDQAVAQYYQAHPSEFMTKEMMSLQYIVLSADHMSDEQLTKLTNLTYTNPDTLIPAAEALGLKVETTPLFGRDGGSTPAFLVNPKILAVAFSDNVLSERNNSDIISIDNTQAIVMRVADYKPSVVRPLKEVRGEIENKLKRQAANNAARVEAEKIVAAITSGNSPQVTWKSIVGLTRQDHQNLPESVVQRAFSLPLSPLKTQTSKSAGVAVSDTGDAFVVLLEKVENGNSDVRPVAVDAQTQANIAQTFANDWGKLEYFLYMQHQIDKSKVVIPGQ